MAESSAPERGTENGRPTTSQRGIAVPRADNVRNAQAAHRASVPAGKAPPPPDESAVMLDTGREVVSGVREAVKKGLSFGKLLSRLHFQDILINMVLYAVKELSLPADDQIRQAYSDGYAAAMAAIAFRGDASNIEAIGWGGKYIDAFNAGRDAAIKEIEASPHMTEASMFEHIFKGKATSLNQKPLVVANAAYIKRKQRYGN